MVETIIKGDKLEEMQRLIREKGINAISPIDKPFNEVELMRIPIIIECLIHRAIKCFKYLLINGIEKPTIAMKEYYSAQFENQYNWDCMAVAIYYGEMEIVKILEEEGITKGDNSSRIEAAIFSYRNTIAKEIINEMKVNMRKQILEIGLKTSAKSNNIKGAELLLNNRADINVKSIIIQIMIRLFLINII